MWRLDGGNLRFHLLCGWVILCWLMGQVLFRNMTHTGTSIHGELLIIQTPPWDMNSRVLLRGYRHLCILSKAYRQEFLRLKTKIQVWLGQPPRADNSPRSETHLGAMLAPTLQLPPECPPSTEPTSTELSVLKKAPSLACSSCCHPHPKMIDSPLCGQVGSGYKYIMHMKYVLNYVSHCARQVWQPYWTTPALSRGREVTGSLQDVWQMIVNLDQIILWHRWDLHIPAFPWAMYTALEYGLLIVVCIC